MKITIVCDVLGEENNGTTLAAMNLIRALKAGGISCLEAISCGLVPVISNSPRCATKAYALTARSLFQFDSPKDLADKIDWWLDHPQERALRDLCQRTMENRAARHSSYTYYEYRWVQTGE